MENEKNIIFRTQVVCCVTPYAVESKQVLLPLAEGAECKMKTKEPFQAGFCFMSANSSTGRGAACSLTWCAVAVLKEMCIMR